MCGIVGYWGRQGRADEGLVRDMARRIIHRGPDDAGTFLDESAGLALAHRRLSILDLSAAGHQPMHSPCGRYVLVYNGEIYNHLDIRDELEAVGGAFNWRGHSDTETLLASLRQFGVEGTLKRLNGMFAFVLWDTAEKTLTLARDRMGEKPLYYGRSGDTFFFGSELKSFAAHPDFQGRVDLGALTLYLRHNYVPAPFSIYEGIQKLPPAHFVVVRDFGAMIAEPVAYWSLREVAGRGATLAGGTRDELVDGLDALLRDAVKRRMMADVPLGTFLSGGIDSSTITALMQAQSSTPVKTFTIGFHEEGYNEAVHAKAIAAHLGTEHHELYVTPEEAMAVIPNIPRYWDEPFSDSSQIPTYLVSALARRHVTVTLSGDGGDELFCGYRRYSQAHARWQKLARLPVPLRQTISAILRMAPGTAIDGLMAVLPGKMQVHGVAERLSHRARIMNMRCPQELYQYLVSHWKSPADIVIGATEPKTLLSDPPAWPAVSDLREWMMYADTLTYLPDDILVKVDRASMAVSLEGRVPLLDHRVVEYAWGVPPEMKFAGSSKWLLREVLYRYVPKSLIDRPKMGFGVPIDSWLRGPLRDWAENLLDEKRLREDVYFDPAPIRAMWQQHVTGEVQNHYALWVILMFQAWLDETGLR